MKIFKIWIIIFIMILFEYNYVSAITIKEEEKLSKEVMKVVFNRFELIRDPSIVNYVEGIGDKILSTLPPQPFVYQFYVIKEPVYNAFATPAGHIFINSGIIQAMDSEEQLAGILAHEIAHVVCRHISQKIERDKKINLATLAGVAAGVLLGSKGSGAASNALTIGSVAAGASMTLAYSREDEMQADTLGISYLSKAGYSPKGLLTILKKMRDKQWFGPKEIPTYLMTHPAIEDRIAYISSCNELNRKYPKISSYDFDIANIRLCALYEDENGAMQRFKAKILNTPYDFLSNYGYALILARNGNRKDAVSYLKKALEKRAFDPFVLSDLGRLYFVDGKYKEALTVLENSMNIGQSNPETDFYLARTQMETGNYSEAIDTFNRLIDKEKDYSKAYYFLGDIYGKQGNTPFAHYYLGIYYYMQPNQRLALFHLSHALKGMTDSEKKQKINEMLKEIEVPPGHPLRPQ
ncbi:MAG: M48 family metalloprotease [Desulfobacterales bacterium]|nr:M48 family metalloprotease [Desulfobacterales bacterium]MBF0397416.1 M48 family metalloprotease [Desulfobacterales bacterium]